MMYTLERPDRHLLAVKPSKRASVYRAPPASELLELHVIRLALLNPPTKRNRRIASIGLPAVLLIANVLFFAFKGSVFVLSALDLVFLFVGFIALGETLGRIIDMFKKDPYETLQERALTSVDKLIELESPTKDQRG